MEGVFTYENGVVMKESFGLEIWKDKAYINLLMEMNTMESGKKIKPWQGKIYFKNGNLIGDFSNGKDGMGVYIFLIEKYEGEFKGGD